MCGRYDPLLRRRLHSLHDLIRATYHELQCRRNDRMVVEACGVALKASLIGIFRLDLYRWQLEAHILKSSSRCRGKILDELG
jgi:hypothetical protein